MSYDLNSIAARLKSQYQTTTSTQTKTGSLSRLSSGVRVSTPAEDGAASTISDDVQVQLSSIKQSVTRANDGVALVDTATSALSGYSSILDQLGDLADQAASGAADADRSALGEQAGGLLSELQRISETVSFQGANLLDGSFTEQALPTGGNGQSVTVSIPSVHPAQLGSVNSGLMLSSISLATAGDASAAQGTIDGAQGTIDSIQSGLNDAAGQLRQALDQLAATSANLSASGASITDATFATQTAGTTRDQIAQNADLALQAQGAPSAEAAMKLLLD